MYYSDLDHICKLYAYITDKATVRFMAVHVQENGHDVLLVNWGEPERAPHLMMCTAFSACVRTYVRVGRGLAGNECMRMCLYCNVL